MFNLLLILSSYFALSNQASEIVLRLNESKDINISSKASVFIEKKGIIKVKDFNSYIRLTGKRTGETKIKTNTQQYRILVLSKRKYETWQALSNWVKGKRGLYIQTTPLKIQLRGHFLTLHDFISLRDINKNIDFSNVASFNLKIQTLIKLYLLETMRKENLVPSAINFNKHLKVSFSKRQKGSKDEFKKILAPFGIKPSLQKSALSLVPMIKIKVIVAQLKRVFFRQWGVSWPAATEAQIIGQNSTSPLSLKLTAHSIEQNGWGKVLATPTLMTQSNKKAHFHSGGEFPIKNTNQFSHQVTWKKYGIFLNILPQADLNKQLRIDITNEISMMDHSQMIDGVPALIKNTFHSIINLKYPRPIIISGLIKKEWGQSRNGLPLLMQIPIFKNLFSESAERDNETELVFILSPEILEP